MDALTAMKQALEALDIACNYVLICEPEYMFHDGLNARANLILAINEINHSEIHQDRVDAEKWREWRMNGFSPIYPREYAIFWIQKSREMCTNMTNNQILDAALKNGGFTL